MEDAHTAHLPLLLLHLLQALGELEANTKPRNLRHCLKLLLFCARKLLNSSLPSSTPSSSSSPPSPFTNLPSSSSVTSSFSSPPVTVIKGRAGSQLISKDLTSAVNSAHSFLSHSGAVTTNAASASNASDEIKINVLTQFLDFFAKFVWSRVCCRGDPEVRSFPPSPSPVSVSVRACFTVCCRLLCALVRMEISATGILQGGVCVCVCVWGGRVWMCTDSKLPKNLYKIIPNYLQLFT